MNTKKLLALALGGVLLVGCLAGCSTAAASQGGISPLGTTTPQTSDTSTPITAVFSEGDEPSNDVSYGELFKPYEQFGLTYDASKNELKYNGKVVRWFEDYYTMEDGGQAGNDFFQREWCG